MNLVVMKRDCRQEEFSWDKLTKSINNAMPDCSDLHGCGDLQDCSDLLNAFRCEVLRKIKIGLGELVFYKNILRSSSLYGLVLKAMNSLGGRYTMLGFLVSSKYNLHRHRKEKLSELQARTTDGGKSRSFKLLCVAVVFGVWLCLTGMLIEKFLA